MPTGPIVLQPDLKHRAWGGTALVEAGKQPSPGAQPPFGESWELADLPASVVDGRSLIKAGPWRGLTLRDAIVRDHDAIMGQAAGALDGGFPLLIKFLDAAENLSVQVHPTEAFARHHAGALVKSEAWLVLRAAPDAAIYRGIDPSLSREAFAALLRGNRVLEALRREPVRAGDFVSLPSGLCHALGAGILVAEIQTASDTSFRLWDWGRNDAARPLHREEALSCMLVGAEQRLDELAIVNIDSAPAVEAIGFRTVTLCRAPEFKIEHIMSVQNRGVATLEVITDDMPVVWVVLTGSISFEPPDSTNGGSVTVGTLETVLLPAAMQGWIARVSAQTRFLRVTLPDRMSRMLAVEE